MTDWRARHFSHLRRALLGGVLAVAGAGFTVALNGPPNPWAYLAAASAVAGIVLGSYHVKRAHAEALAQFRRMDRAAAELRAKRRDG